MLLVLIFICPSFKFVHFCLFLSEKEIVLHEVIKQRPRRENKCHGEEIHFLFLMFVYLCALLVTKLGIINPAFVNKPQWFGHFL